MLIDSHIWVSGLIRRAEMAGASAVVARRGDARAGAVILKAYNTLERSARLYVRAQGNDGEPLWIEPVIADTESQLDAYIERQLRYDPDLWVVEVEDRQGRSFLDEPVANP